MATTAIQIGEVKLKIMTLIGEPSPSLEGGTSKHFLNIEIRQCDDDFIPTGKSSVSISDLDEETYHRNLRKESSKEGHLVPHESTDPEWTPGYVPTEEIAE